MGWATWLPTCGEVYARFIPAAPSGGSHISHPMSPSGLICRGARGDATSFLLPYSEENFMKHTSIFYSACPGSSSFYLGVYN